MPRPSKGDWALAERLYFEGKLTIAKIAEQCQVSVNGISHRASKFGWPRVKERGRRAASPERAMLRRIINKKLAALEKRMEDPETTNPADNERDARAFSSLLGSVDKLDAEEAARREAAAAALTDHQLTAKAAPYGDADVEQWRHELARRIASLSAKWRQ